MKKIMVCVLLLTMLVGVIGAQAEQGSSVNGETEIREQLAKERKEWSSERARLKQRISWISQNGEYTRHGNRAIVKSLAAATRGWRGSQWVCLDRLVGGESAYNHRARNRSSGAYGIPQALPGRKMASAGSDWQVNPATQALWLLGYVAARYGTPCRALSAWRSRSPHWY